MNNQVCEQNKDILIEIKNLRSQLQAAEEFFNRSSSNGNASGRPAVSRESAGIMGSVKAHSGSEIIFNSVNDVILMHKWTEDGLPGKFLAVNEVACERLGYSQAELLSMSPADIDDPESAQGNPDITRRLLAGERPVFERIHVSKQGRRIPVEISARLLEMNGESVILSCCRDISKRRRAETALREAEKESGRLAMAVEQAAEAIVIARTSGEIHYANPAVFQISGMPSAEVLGKHASVFLNGQQNPDLSQMLETLREGKTWSGRLDNHRPDGSAYIVDGTITPLRDAEGHIVDYVLVARDVTSQVLMESQLRHAHKMEAIGKLAGGVAHDFNNLLQTIIGYTHLMIMDGRQKGADISDLEQIQNASEKATALTRQLLAFGRRSVLQRSNIDMNQIIADIMKMLRRVIGEQVEIEFLPGKSVKTTNADCGQMEQVLINLCMNARDAMPGGGTITLATQNFSMDAEYVRSHPWAQEGDYVLVLVSDTGAGMTKEVRERIFEPFFTTKEEGRGTGLGLATSYGIIKQHGGYINVYSEPGGGSVFRIYLPTVEKPAEPVQKPVELQTVRGNETILLAEDDEDVRRVAVRILEEAGYTVIIASNGEEVVQEFQDHSGTVDLVLLDVVMPRMGGRAASEEIRRIQPGVQVLFSSGYGPSAIQKGFVVDESLQVIQKPYDPKELLQQVRGILDGAKRRAA